MLNWLKKLLKGLLNLLKKLWPVLLIAGLAIFFLNPALFSAIIQTAGSWLSAIPGLLGTGAGWFIGLFQGLSFWEATAAIVGASFLLDPKKTSEAIGTVIGAVGDTVSDVAGAVTTGVVSALFSSPLFWVAAAVGVYMLVSDDSEDTSSRAETRSWDREVEDQPWQESVNEGGTR